MAHILDQTLRWRKHGMIAVFILIPIIVSILVLYALLSPISKTAGIATIQFNISTQSLGIGSKRDIFGSAESIAASAAGSIQTAAPAVVSKVQSAAGSAATAVDNHIKNLLPQNCTIGTSQFCVTYTNGTSCDDLPLSLTEILPNNALDSLLKHIDLKPVDQSLGKISTPYIQGFLVAALVTMLLMASLVVHMFRSVFTSSQSSTQHPRLRMGTHALLGVVSCICFVVPVVALFDLQSKAQHLPAEIVLMEGNINGIAIASFCCTCVLLLLATLAPVFERRDKLPHQAPTVGTTGAEKGTLPKRFYVQPFSP